MDEECRPIVYINTKLSSRGNALSFPLSLRVTYRPSNNNAGCGPTPLPRRYHVLYTTSADNNTGNEIPPPFLEEGKFAVHQS